MKEKYQLRDLNTFKVEALADYYFYVESVTDLIAAISFAQRKNIPYLFLGGGSNVLLTQNFNGVVISVGLKGVKTEIIDDQSALVTAAAGENWHDFVQLCIKNDFGGLENLSLIPGNVGTSPIQNIGAYGVEIKDVMHSCKVLNLENFKIEELFNQDCQFGYRDSIFKSARKGDFVILEVTFKLSIKDHRINASYGAISQKLLDDNVLVPTIRDVSNAIISIRESKLPNPTQIGNAGSFFKNPTITISQYESLNKQYPNMPGYPNDYGVKVPAGWLIEQAGWKGKQVNNVATYHLQSLVIINKTGKASGKEIFDFSAEIIASVHDKFGINLEREVNII